MAFSPSGSAPFVRNLIVDEIIAKNGRLDVIIHTEETPSDHAQDQIPATSNPGTILANRVTFLPRPPDPRFPDSSGDTAKALAARKARRGFNRLAGHHEASGASRLPRHGSCGNFCSASEATPHVPELMGSVSCSPERRPYARRSTLELVRSDPPGISSEHGRSRGRCSHGGLGAGAREQRCRRGRLP